MLCDCHISRQAWSSACWSLSFSHCFAFSHYLLPLPSPIAFYHWLLPLTCRTASLIKSGKLADLTVEDTQRNYKKALEKGVLKILSKMGISLLSCYHGAQIFEIYGLGQDIVDTAFRGSVSRIGGMTFDDLQKEVESFWVKVCLLL